MIMAPQFTQPIDQKGVTYAAKMRLAPAPGSYRSLTQKEGPTVRRFLRLSKASFGPSKERNFSFRGSPLNLRYKYVVLLL